MLFGDNRSLEAETGLKTSLYQRVAQLHTKLSKAQKQMSIALANEQTMDRIVDSSK